MAANILPTIQFSLPFYGTFCYMSQRVLERISVGMPSQMDLMAIKVICYESIEEKKNIAHDHRGKATAVFEEYTLWGLQGHLTA